MFLIKKNCDMKNLKFINYCSIFIFVMSMLSLSSCSDDDSGSSGEGPVIEKVSAAVDEDGQPTALEPTTVGYANNLYIIHGSGFSTLKKVYFNDTDTSFNPNLVTDTDIFVTIDINTPYANASNKLKLVTEYGEVEYDFVVAPPAPQVTSFNSINTADGGTFTIYGTFFLDPVVTVGTTEATVISSTLTEIQAVMPANSMNKYVTVTTISGASTYERAVGSALYDDELLGDAGHWTWSPMLWDLAFADDKVQGANSMKIEFGGWTGLDMNFTPKDVTQYKAFRLQIKGSADNANASIKLVFGGWAFQIIRPLTTQWTTIEVPFSEIGNPTSFSQLTMQESGGFGGNTILIDNIGFILND